MKYISRLDRAKRRVSGCVMVLSMGLFSASALAGHIPLIQTRSVELIHAMQCVEPEEENGCAMVQLKQDWTGLDWLDAYLLRQLAFESLPARSAADELKMQVTAQARQWLDSSYVDIEASWPTDARLYSRVQSRVVQYLYQRGHLAFFRVQDYSQDSGSRALYGTRFLVMDLERRTRLHLDDILEPGAKPALLELLLQEYKDTYPDIAEGWLRGDGLQQLAEFEVDNFVFDEPGLTFVYPLYQLGTPLSGEVRLTLTPLQHQWLVKPEYNFFAPGE